MLQYHRFDPGPCGFPRPRVPVLPPLSWAELSLGANLARDAELRRFARGRYALRAAYELSGVGPHGSLLAPAYHCRTMLDGAIRLGGEARLYPLTPELEPDLSGVERAAAACRTPPKALLFTHYFGLPRDIAPVAEWCRSRGVALIEDCSHALVSFQDGGRHGNAIASMGHAGRYAASSPYKFFACPDGGLLWSPQRAPLPTATHRRADLRAQARGLWSACRQLAQRRAAPDAGAIAAELAALCGKPAPSGRDWIEAPADPTTSHDYVTADEALGSLVISRWIQSHTDVMHIVRRRRERYAQWADAVSDLPGCRALFATLPAGSTPYMFPLRVDDPPRRFYPLKRLGVPIWRWDDMAVSDCAVSRDYRQGVFHLPCHQALDDGEMRWMTAAVRHVMRE